MAADDSGPVTRADVDALAMSLPEVTSVGTAEHPAYAVRGKRFLLWRGPRRDALEPGSGEPMPDVIAVVVPGPDDKQALLQSGPPWFTTPHFDGYDYVLVRGGPGRIAQTGQPYERVFARDRWTLWRRER